LLRSRVCLLAAGTALAVGAALSPAPARADGAFPDSMRVLVPPDRPQQIMLGTNFGLVVSNDAGAHWHLVCEEAIATGGEYVTQYLMSGPPADTLYAMSINQLSVSDDRGCSWGSAGGLWTDPAFTDIFPDPTNPARVFALALVRNAQDFFVSSLFDSRDGGHRFGAPLFEAGQSVLLTGVESTASTPQTIYLTEYGNPAGGVISSLARSSDDGRTFREVSLLDALGMGEARLAAIDPSDPRVIYYRVLSPEGADRLAISRDGGDTAQVALALKGLMTTFLRRADGTLLVGTAVEGAFVSRDGGRTFAPLPRAPHLRWLAERAGVLYAATDNIADKFAVASSSDDGQTWMPLLRFENLCGILDCSPGLRATCQAAWSRLVDLLGITGCADNPHPADASADGAADAAAAPKQSHGCSCRSSGSSGGPFGLLLLASSLVIAAGRDLRRRFPSNRRMGTLPARWHRL
jgi:hypothetical protein